MAFRWRADDGQTLDAWPNIEWWLSSFVIRTSIDKETYSFVISGRGRGPDQYG